MRHHSHYNARFLTRPWEIGKRELCYVDLQAGRVGRCSSRSLFAVQDGLETDLERLLSRHVEGPVGEIRKRWLATGKRPKLKSWAEHRALFLLLALQPALFLSLRRRAPIVSLDLLREPEAVIDQFVAALKDQNNVATFVTPPQHPLFFPETGAFTFFVPDHGCVTGWTLAVGLAVHPRILVAMLSKSVNDDVLTWLSVQEGHLTTLSVGNANGLSRVVVGDEYISTHGEAETVRIVREAHARNQTLMTQQRRARETAAQIWEHAGFSLREREVGDPIEQYYKRGDLVPAADVRPSRDGSDGG